MSADQHRRSVLGIAGLAAIAIAILLLFVTADGTPSGSRRLFGLWQTRYFILSFFLFLLAAGAFAEAVSRQIFLVFLSVGMSSGACLILLEIAGATGAISWPALLGPRGSALGAEPAPNLDISGMSYQDTASGWGMPSGPIPFRYKTDRRGFRNEQDRADAEIYLVGDSVLVAALVPFPDTVTARLERLIQRPVAQVALIGKSPQEVQQLFRDSGLPIKGRLVIQFVFEDNDLIDSKRFRQPPMSAQQTSWRENSLTNQLILKLQILTQPVSGTASLRTCKIEDQNYTFLWGRQSFAGLEEEIGVIESSLQDFGAEIRQSGGQFGVVFVPAKLRVLGPVCQFPSNSELSEFSSHIGPFREKLGLWAKNQRVDYLDLTEPLVAGARGNRIPWFWGDTHWNADGHAIAAEALSNWRAVKELAR